MKQDYRLLKISVYTGATALILWMVTHYWPAVERGVSLLVGAATPLIAGCIMAYAVNILMVFYETHLPRMRLLRRKSLRRAFSMLLAILSLLVIIALLLTIVLPELIQSVRLLAEEVPPALEELIAWVNEQSQLNGKSPLPESISTWLDKLTLTSDGLLEWALSQIDHIVPAVFNVVTSAFSIVVSALLMFIFAIYLLSGKEKLATQFASLMDVYLKPSRAAALRHVLATFNDCFHSYIVGQCLEALILGALCTLGMLIFRFPYALMVGTLVGFTALIPIAGAYIGAFAGAFMIFTVDPIKGLFFLIYIVVLQQIEGNIIYPRVVGTSLGLPGIWVLAAVMIGGSVAGVGGMLIGVPLCAALYRLLREDVARRKAAPPAAEV